MSPTPLALPSFTTSTVLEEDREQKYNEKDTEVHCINFSMSIFHTTLFVQEGKK